MPISSRLRPNAVVPLILLTALLLAAVCAIWVGVRAAIAAGHLNSAQEIAARVPSSFTEDPAALSQMVMDLQNEAASARALTSDPIWVAAEILPWVGPQLTAVGALSEAADTLAQRAVPPLATQLGPNSLSAFAPRDGALPLTEFAPIAEASPAAAAAVSDATQTLADVPTAALLPRLRGLLQGAQGQVEATATLIEGLQNAAALLPPMLGGEERREYLLVFQNNAELRSLGGMPGSLARVDAEDGRIQLVGQYTASDFAIEGSVGELGPEIDELFGGPDRVISASTEIPDFRIAAPLILDYWHATQGSDLDGVIAIDPVALSYLLRATGPITLPNGDVLTAENAVPTLLNEVYLKYGPAEQNLYFAAATAAVFGALTAGDYNAPALLTALAQAGSERRILLHSTHADEQEILAGTTLSGPLADGADFGVYLNDGTGSKMDYYLDAEAVVAANEVADAANLTLTLTSTAPDDAATLPPSVTGGGGYGVPPGTIRTIIYIYLPEGAQLRKSSAGGFKGFVHATHAGRQVLATHVDLRPGESAVAEISIVAGPGTRIVDPGIVITPQVR